MYNIVNRHGVVLASVGAYTQAQTIVTYYNRRHIVATIQGAVK